MKIKSSILLAGVLLAFSQNLRAQSDIYPEHFDLDEVTLLDGPLKTAMDINNKLLLEYDADRLLTPFIRQAGLSRKSGSKYNGWETKHPSFSNWGQSSWSLEGHVGGHYLTALALAYAATDDATTKTKMKECLDYCLNILKDCQDAYDSNTQGLYGFIGGQPINQIWTGLYANDLTAFRQYGGWVPFYCEHKVLAGLRDAWLYTKSEVAKELYRKLCDWSVNVVSKLNTSDMQTVLGWEHGGMNETLADAYKIFGDKKYLTAAKKFSHNTMVENMQTLNTTFLDGKHANTQVPKYIGFERIYQLDNTATTYQKAAHNFWQDVVEHRTVAIGGNSVSEHFLAANRGSQYMENLEGPESCNSNNMLKLSEDLFDETHDAKYADFYESTTWNHILSTQDPKTGGYVYFTTLRPQSYRIYSKVNQGMWCCVGTGMENHAKYGHFIYTHSTDNATLYVNQFTASKLNSDKFGVTQTTEFPFVQSTKLTIDKGSFNLAVRHPAWVGKDYSVSVNGKKQSVSVKEGVASYVQVKVKKGDVVEINLPMSLRYEECPNYTDYVAFKYGPILLAAQTTAMNAADAKVTGLEYEQLKNEYAGEGRMDHSPGAMATSKS
ncbi:MAG: glycoside hydrolase family 127 protein, partial [Bacteroidaceae bacterium]|nr:glycoside hydrolase family 127 protein [Bacteroidaceae bacterium]